MQGFIKTYSLWFDQPRIHETYLRTGAIYRWQLTAIWCQKVYLTSKSYIFHSCIFQRFTMSVVKNILIWEEWGHSIITLSQNALNLEPPHPPCSHMFNFDSPHTLLEPSKLDLNPPMNMRGKLRILVKRNAILELLRTLSHGSWYF